MARRGGLLDADADAAARGVFDRLFGLVGEAAVVPETVNEEQSLVDMVREQACQRALTRKQTLRGRQRT